MRKLHYFIATLSCLLLCLASCQRVEPVEDPAGEHTCELRLVGGVIPFDGGTKASGDFTPNKDNRLYIRMEGAVGPVLGVAKYNESNGAWSFTYNGTLGGATQGAAHAILIEKNIRSESGHHLELTQKTPIYEDADASFSVTVSGLSLNTTLAPKTGRISLAHDLAEGEGRFLNGIGGISYYDRFDLSDFSFTSVDIAKLGYMWIYGGSEQYFYGFYTDAQDPQIMVYPNDAGGYYFFRHMPLTSFLPGQSGYVTYPTENGDNIGWRRYPTSIDVEQTSPNGGSHRKICMLFVPGGTFRMGNDKEETASPVHDVTLGHYYISQSEITRDFWYTVMGEPSYWEGDSYPVTERTYEQIQSFIAELNTNNNLSGQSAFRLPTEAEWEFAARGGIYSHDYTYSGSNTLRDVAVRQENIVVNMKSQNELGLHDMSGNVAELCADWYGPYAEGPQFRPSGASSGDYRVVRGGYAWDDEEFFTVWHRASTEYYPLPNSAVGFRLVMGAPAIDR